MKQPVGIGHNNFDRSDGVIDVPAAEVIPAFSVLWPEKPGRNQDANRKFQQTREQVLDESLLLVAPKAVWAIADATDAARVVSPGVPQAILEKTNVYIGVICTLGGDLDANVRRYFESRDSTRGYFLDQVGSMAVAALARRVSRLLCDGHSAVRWAPGDYDGDWALRAQRALFHWVPGKRIGVELTPRNVMKPVKSLSYVLLIGAEPSKQRCFIDCRSCVWNGRCRAQEMHVSVGNEPMDGEGKG
jgi:hypothetical protein